MPQQHRHLLQRTCERVEDFVYGQGPALALARPLPWARQLPLHLTLHLPLQLPLQLARQLTLQLPWQLARSLPLARQRRTNHLRRQQGAAARHRQAIIGGICRAASPRCPTTPVSPRSPGSGPRVHGVELVG